MFEKARNLAEYIIPDIDARLAKWKNKVSRISSIPR